MVLKYLRETKFRYAVMYGEDTKNIVFYHRTLVNIEDSGKFPLSGKVIAKDLFTGRKDSFGIDIYENDITELIITKEKIVRGEVVWFEDGFRLRTFAPVPVHYFLSAGTLNLLGNNYHNKHLRKTY